MKRLVNDFGSKNWKKISESLNKTPVQCLHRWTKILKPGLIKGPWSIEEDRKLLDWVRREGPSKWSQCAEFINGRSGKQCRERWFNTLHPEVRRGFWSAEEDFIIFQSFSKFGSKWSQMAKELPGRTENSIKNRFYSTLRRIASDAKKIRVNTPNFCPSESASTFSTATTSLTDLLRYFPQALEEKTKLYLQYKESTCNELHSTTPTLKELKENLKKEETFLNKKTSRNFKTPHNTTNINNTYNFNVNITSSSLIEALQPKKKNETVEELETAIEKWCGDDSNINDIKDVKDEVFENLEVKINRLIEKDTLTQKKNLQRQTMNLINNLQQTPVGVNTGTACVNALNSNGNNPEIAYSNLLSQLNELERILQATKQELYMKFEKKSEINEVNNSNNNSFISAGMPVSNVNFSTGVPNNDSSTNYSNPFEFNAASGNVNPFNISNFGLTQPILSSNLFLNNYNNINNFNGYNNKPLGYEDLYADDANNALFEHMFKF